LEEEEERWKRDELKFSSWMDSELKEEDDFGFRVGGEDQEFTIESNIQLLQNQSITITKYDQFIIIH